LRKRFVDTWLAAQFDPKGPSAENVKAIDKLDQKYAKSLA
jgi:ribose 5-phosphate isomerase B